MELRLERFGAGMLCGLSGLTLALSGRPQRPEARGRRKLNGTPAAR